MLRAAPTNELAPPAIINRSLVPVGLSDVVLQLNAAVRNVSNLGELFDDRINGRIVIFRYAMAGDKRIANHRINPPRLDGGLQFFHHGVGDQCAGSGLLRNNDRRRASAIDKQMSLDLLLLNSIEQAGSGEPAVNFLRGSSPFQYQTLSFSTGLTPSNARPLVMASASIRRLDDLPPPGAPNPAETNLRM
jgi:hypothetical protein